MPWSKGHGERGGEGRGGEGRGGEGRGRKVTDKDGQRENHSKEEEGRKMKECQREKATCAIQQQGHIQIQYITADDPSPFPTDAPNNLLLTSTTGSRSSDCSVDR